MSDELVALLDVHRIGWNWYRYHVISPPDVNVMGHGSRKFVRNAVSRALIDAQDPEHLRAHLEAAATPTPEVPRD